MKEGFYETLFKQLNTGAIITDSNENVVSANSAYLCESGFNKEEIKGLPICDLLEGYSKNGQSQWKKDVLIKRKNGSKKPQWLFLNHIEETDSKAVYKVWLMTDFQICGLDPLTRLPNRFLFNQKLNDAVQMARENSTTLAVLFVDVDRFKFINDTFGHACGDQLLIQAAHRINMAIGDHLLARMGGDEFVCLLNDLRDEREAEDYAKKVIKAFSEPFALKDTELYITTSVGISVYPYDGDDGDLLISDADTAMYRAKKRGRNQYEKVKVDVNAGGFEMLLLENSLRKAIVNNELTLFFQPQIQLSSNEIVSFEALIRWNHPELGMISPGDFIPLAEETGLILPLGDWVLRTACEKIREWKIAGYPPIRIAVNLSASQFLHNDLVNKVKRVLTETSVSPSYLELEITENMVMHDVQAAIQVLKQLKEIGVKISIDDFGTGYSSLNYLKEFPVDTLKIDRSFIKDIDYNQNSVALTKAITTLAHDLQLQVIAEGVENSKQLGIVQKYDCDAVQGSYFSKPLSDEHVIQYLLMYTKNKQHKVG